MNKEKIVFPNSINKMLYSNSKNNIKTNSSINQRYIETTPNMKYNLVLENNNYSFKRKDLYNPEKIKIKESIFTSFKEVSKRQLKKEKDILKKKYKELFHSISILKNANLDEGIVLNKYFSYLKRNEIEYNELIKANIQNLLTPIRKKEKEIQNMKKKLKFYKSISNQMLFQYMIDKKDKLYEYMKEIKSSKNEYYESNNDSHTNRKLTNTSDKNNSKSNSIYNMRKNSFLLAHSKNNAQKNIFLRRQLLENNNKKVVPKLNLNDDINNFFITAYSKNTNKTSNKNIVCVTENSPKRFVRINKKYNSSESIKKTNKLYNINTEKSNEKTRYSTRYSCKLKNLNTKNLFLEN